MLLIFTATIFLSSALLFVIQPIFAKMVLPLLGGAPAIWITSILFFQVVLLAGYAYAHWGPERLGNRRHAIMHLALLAGAALALPVGVPGGWVPDESRPVIWLLALLTVSLGLPFFAMSASGPLLQRWFSATRHPYAADPYFLYRASNAGSMLALLGYPLLLEPLASLGDQGAFWSIGYGLLFVFAAGSAYLLLRYPAAPQELSPDANARSEARIGWTRRLRWVALAFVPSSLMLGVTTYLTTDIAAIPLLWVVPLSLYLLTFILVFGRKSLVPTRIAVRIQPFILIPVALLFLLRATRPPLLLLAHLLAVLAVGVVCHGRIAEDRPAAGRLTEFYLWIAVGGALGGFFNAVIAPVAFDNIIEYPIALVLACLLRPGPGKSGQVRAWRWDLLLPVILLVLMLTVFAVFDRPGTAQPIVKLAALGTAALVVFSFAERPLRFALGMTAMLIAGAFLPTDQPASVLYASRTFFGSQKVVQQQDTGIRRLVHGNTIHGAQSTKPGMRREPLTYFHRGSPIGEVFGELGSGFSSIGVVGLGTGSLACYSTGSQLWTFYEIDPEIEHIARDANLFTFLNDCEPEARVIIGDARLSLRDAQKDVYDLLVIDAFNSDAIPLHLLTKEALDLYLDKVAEQGIIAFHISNSYVDLRPVLRQLADDAGMLARVAVDRDLTMRQRVEEGKAPSIWVVLARSPAALGTLADDPEWGTPGAQSGVGLWTDDFSNLLSVFRWRGMRI